MVAKHEDGDSPNGWALGGALIGGLYGYIIQYSEGLSYGPLLIFLLGLFGAVIANEVEYQWLKRKGVSSAKRSTHVRIFDEVFTKSEPKIVNNLEKYQVEMLIEQAVEEAFREMIEEIAGDSDIEVPENLLDQYLEGTERPDRTKDMSEFHQVVSEARKDLEEASTIREAIEEYVRYEESVKEALDESIGNRLRLIVDMVGEERFEEELNNLAQ